MTPAQTSANSYCIDTVVDQRNTVKSERFIDLFCALEHLDWPLGGVFVSTNNNNTLYFFLSTQGPCTMNRGNKKTEIIKSDLKHNNTV